MLQQGRDALRARLSEGLGGLLPPLRVASIGAPHVEALPLELSMEALVVAPFSWPESCPICFEPLVKHERFLLCSAAHVACLTCALGCLRASLEHDEAVCACAEKGALCYYLKDAIAAAFHGPRLAAAARGVAEEALELASLSLREVHLLLRGLELAHHERPGLFSFSPCPGCRDPLLLPAQYAATGRPAYCHACTHRVCPRCDVMWAESGHDTRGCGAVQDAKKAAAEDARVVVARALGDERAARCPQCSHAVVKEDQAQCNHIRCICGAEFCYLCTAKYTRDVMGVLQCAHSKKCPQNDSHSSEFRFDGSLPLYVTLLDPLATLGVTVGLCRLSKLPPRTTFHLAIATAAWRIFPTLFPVLPFAALEYATAHTRIRGGRDWHPTHTFARGVWIPLVARIAGHLAFLNGAIAYVRRLRVGGSSS